MVRSSPGEGKQGLFGACSGSRPPSCFCPPTVSLYPSSVHRPAVVPGAPRGTKLSSLPLSSMYFRVVFVGSCCDLLEASLIWHSPWLARPVRVAFAAGLQTVLVSMVDVLVSCPYLIPVPRLTRRDAV